MKNAKKVKDAIKVLLDNDLEVTDGTFAKIWYADDDILDEGEEGNNYIVSDNGEGCEFEHNHKTFDSAFKEFVKRCEL